MLRSCFRGIGDYLGKSAARSCSLHLLTQIWPRMPCHAMCTGISFSSGGGDVSFSVKICQRVAVNRRKLDGVSAEATPQSSLQTPLVGNGTLNILVIAGCYNRPVVEHNCQAE